MTDLAIRSETRRRLLLERLISELSPDTGVEKTTAASGLRLYVVPHAANSQLAFANLRRICGEPLVSMPQVEIIDVAAHPERAIEDGVSVTPTLVRADLEPVGRLIGTLADTDALRQFLNGLDVSQNANAHRPLTELVEQFFSVRTKLQEAIGGQIDSVVDPARGGAFLLENAQSDLRDLSERLAQSKEHLECVQEVAGFGSSEENLSTGELIWSKELFGLLGLDAADVSPSAEAFLAVVHADHRSKVVRAQEEALVGQKVGPVDFRIVRPDGTERWLLAHHHLVRDGTGRPVSLIVTRQDITDFKLVQERLRSSDEHLSRAQRLGKIGSAEIDLRSLKTYWSDETYRLFGLDPSASDAPGQALIATMTHPEDHSAQLDFNDMILSGVAPAPFEARVILQNGVTRWMRQTAEVLADPQGAPAKILLTIQDISELKESEARLRTSEEHLALAQQIGAIGSAEHDYATDSVYWSDGLYHILGRERPTLSPMLEAWLAYVHPGDRDRVESSWNRQRLGESVPPFEMRIVRPEGEIRWLRRQCAILRDAEGRPRRAIMAVQDITEARNASLQRRELEAQLAQSQKMEAIGQLTGGIAHDFNNILAVVIGNLDLLNLIMTEEAETRLLVEEAIAASLKGSELTKSLLAFSRRQPLQPKLADLNRLLGHVLPMARRAIGKTITMQISHEEMVWPVVIDPSLMEAAVLNMIVNARDAMPQGGTIFVKTANAQLDQAYAELNSELTPGDYAMIEISDTGCGMTPEVMSRAFEPFFTTKDMGRGTGLGLAMVFGFIKQSGGHIKILSQVGRGTTIRVYLPRASGQHGAIEELDGPAAETESKGETILVVDDNAEVRAAVTRQLAAIGYLVIEADNAAAAMAMLESGRQIDLVFSDVVMPGAMGGAELAAQVKARHPSIKIVLTSGFPQELLNRESKVPDGIVLLAKPYRMADLARKLREVIDG